MPKCLDCLYSVHLELTSRCNKNCWCCGRRVRDKKYPELTKNYGDMNIGTALNIVDQLPNNIVLQFHNNGEPLLYPYLSEVLSWSYRQIRCLDTNGKLLLEKANIIIGNMETITISVIENDPEGDEQYEIVKKFLKIKKDRKPRLIYRLLGDVSYSVASRTLGNDKRWYKLPGQVVTRTLHSPLGSYNYKKCVTIPEIGICLEMLNHMAIDRFGKVSPCVRFDPRREAVIGDTNENTVEEIWNGEKRKHYLKKHIEGKRDELPLCNKCHYWGCPIS